MNESVEIEMDSYNATSSIIIGKNASLIIKGDVDISFAPNRGVYVIDSGVLKVLGKTTMKPIDSQWYGIYLRTNNNTILENLSVEKGTTCLRQGPNVLGEVSVNNSTLQDCIQDAIWIQSDLTKMMISTSRIWNAGRYGIYSDRAIDLTLVDSHIANSSSYTLYVRGAKNATISGNTIMQAISNTPAIYLYRPQEVTVVDNIMKCRRECINLNTFTIATIHGNTMSGIGYSNSYQMAYFYASGIYGEENIRISNNIFEDWNSPSYDAVYLYFDGIGSSLMMVNNTFKDMRARHILSLKLSVRDEKTNIANNFFGALESTDSSFPSIMYISRWDSNHPNAHSSLIGNIFNLTTWKNDTEQYALALNLNVDSIEEIDASLSYWGSDNVDEVLDRIFDGLDDIDLTTVKYLPYLLTPDINGPVSTNSTNTNKFLRPGSILKGILSIGETVTLLKEDSPYIAEGTLIIDGQLIIGENVTISMEGGSNFIVRKGNVDAKGSVELPITFDKKDSDAWGGIFIDPKYQVTSGFKMLLAYSTIDDDNIFSLGKDQFNHLFNSSQSKVLYRHCPFCSTSYRNLFYKRLTNISSFDAYDYMTCSWIEEDNSLNVDFGGFYIFFSMIVFLFAFYAN